MPRPANLDRRDVLERAMHLFWERGYRALSMDALVREIGTTRFSLYREFGGKHGLFEATLDHYADHVVGDVLRPMTDTDAGLDGIARYFDDIFRDAGRRGRLARGCLMTNTMTEVGDADRGIRRRTEAHFRRVACAFERALGRARSRGELRAEAVDLHAWSVHLATFAQGVWACARSGLRAAQLRAAVRAFLDSVRAASPRSRKGQHAATT